MFLDCRKLIRSDEMGEFPKDMPRGVLSEDGLDNLLSDIASVRARIAALVEEPNDKNWETKYQEYDPLVDSPESTLLLWMVRFAEPVVRACP